MRLPFVLLPFLVVVAGVTCVFLPEGVSVRAQALRVALEGADRVTIQAVEPPSANPQPLAVISGAERIAGLVQALDFKDTRAASSARASGTMN